MTQRRVLMAPYGTLSTRRQCELLAVPRSSVYYEPVAPDAEELALMRRIDELHLQHPFFGSRMITQTLKAASTVINRKRGPATDASDGPREHGAEAPDEHAGAGPSGLPVSAARARDRAAEPGVGHGYHLHPDGARLRLPGGDHRLVLPPGAGVAAVQHAGHGLLPRGPAGRFGRPTIFNTDQGSQFTAGDFTRALRDREIKISMDGKGRYLDNIFVERLWRSLKYEEIYLHPYDSLTEAREGIGRYFRFYNDARPHTSLGYQTPAAFYDSTSRCPAA